MIIQNTSISDIKVIEPQVYRDSRGYFYESFNQSKFENLIQRKVKFVQDNHSRSVKNVLRGLHYQKPPFEQGKLVRVVVGEIYDVAVDVRKNSPTYGNWIGEILSAKNKKQLWIPEGFAHGFLTLSETAELLYKTTEYYEPESEKILKWNDKEINIQWPTHEHVLLSEKDQNNSITLKQWT